MKRKHYHADAVAETLQLCHAWLAYLLLRSGERTLRIPAGDIADALRTLSCTVEREGNEYVITVGKREAAP